MLDYGLVGRFFPPGAHAPGLKLEVPRGEARPLGSAKFVGTLEVLIKEYALTPNVPLLKALWSLLDGIWGVLKGNWGMLEYGWLSKLWSPFGSPKY